MDYVNYFQKAIDLKKKSIKLFDQSEQSGQFVPIIREEKRENSSDKHKKDLRKRKKRDRLGHS